MSDTIVSDLKALRDALHAKRAQIASDAAGLQTDKSSSNWHATDGSNYGPDLNTVQEQIEAVDRAIDDEQTRGPKTRVTDVL